jgi:GT2 family glycosyltransferase
MSAVDLAIIILNYRTADLTRACLESLEHEAAPGIRVVIVDNASGDGSAEALAKLIADRGWSAWATLLTSPVNGGFAAGNNLGIRSVDARAYVLLNSDTIVRRGAMAALQDAMRARPRAGIIGAGLVTKEGTPDGSFFRIPGPLSEFVRAANTGIVERLLARHAVTLPASDLPLEPGWVGFACVLIRREVIDAVGLLDAGFFMYFEDLDYCRRARAAGWGVLYWPDAKVVHLLGGSSKITEHGRHRRRAPRYFYEARARYFARYYGRPGLWAANCLWHLGRLVCWPRELLGRAPSRREREATDIWIDAFRSQGGPRG